MIRVRLFDSFGLFIDGAPAVFPYRQAEQALLYVILSVTKTVEKDGLAEILWPDRPPGVARGNLRHVVYVLRSTGGLGEYLASTKSRLSIDGLPDDSCDAFVFRKLLASEPKNGSIAEKTRKILEVYKNGLLADYTAEPSAEYGFWLYRKKQEFQHLLYSHLHGAIPRLCEEREHSLLKDLAGRLVVWDPYDTSLFEFLLRSLVSQEESGFAEKLFRETIELAENSSDAEAVGGIADLSRRVFPDRTSYPIKKKLPVQVVPFVGRGRELTELDELVRRREARLVTITAPGGYGKTSVAAALGRRMDASIFPDGVCFVDWRGCSNQAACVEKVLAGLGLAGADLAAEKTVLRFIEDKKILIVLDEVEGRSFAFPFIDRMLRSAPDLKILAAARSSLGPVYEWVYSLQPLEVDTEAAELFLMTAERKTGRRGWTDKERKTAKKICRLLSGVPLALEMAASRMTDPDLEGLYRLLRGLPENFLSGDMEKTIEYQISLLDENIRGSFYHLAHFVGDFDKKTAEEAFLIPEGAFAEYRRLSLVWPSGNGLYRLHGHVRAYALSRMKKAGDFDSSFERLCLHLAAVAERHFLRLFSLKEDPLEIAFRYPAELEESYNFALREKRWNTALKLAVPLGSYLHFIGFARKAKRLITNEFESRAGADPKTLSAEVRRFLLHLGQIAAVLELQKRNVPSARKILSAMRGIDEAARPRFLQERKGEKDLYRRYLTISLPWLQGLVALYSGLPKKAERLFLASRKKALASSAHLCRVYVDMHLALLAFGEAPEKAGAILENVLKSSHGRHVSGIRSDAFLLLAELRLGLGEKDEASSWAEAVLREPGSLPASRTEMQALFLLALLHIGGGDREIPRVYLLRALETARKNGLYSMAADSSLRYLRGWIGAFGAPPDWEVYEIIAGLARGPGSKRRRKELDRIFGLR